MLMHANALTWARTVQKSLPLFFLFICFLSKSYYRKVKNVIYGGYERTWPLSYKIGHRKFRPNYKFLEKNHDIFRVGQDLRGLPCSIPASFSWIFPLTVQIILQNNQIASAKYCTCMIPGMPAWSLSSVITRSFLFIPIKADMPHPWLLLPGATFLSSSADQTSSPWPLPLELKVKVFSNLVKSFPYFSSSYFLPGCQSGLMTAENNHWQSFKDPFHRDGAI